MAIRNSKARKYTFGMIVAMCSIVWSNSDVKAQNGLIADEYCRIIPGVSTRYDVEQMFAAAKDGKFNRVGNTVEFDNERLAVRVEYSTGKCGDTLPDYGTFPKWTVIAVSYMWPDDDQIPLKGVIFDLRKFSKMQESDVIVHDNYVNDEGGIDIVYDRKRRSVDGIYLQPGARLRAKYGKCQ